MVIILIMMIIIIMIIYIYIYIYSKISVLLKVQSPSYFLTEKDTLNTL
jgi:hypothetical protein